MKRSIKVFLIVLFNLILITELVMPKQIFAASEGNSNSLNGWVREYDNYYYYQNDQKLRGWQKLDSNWYYFDQSGAMCTGWLVADGKVYYLNDFGEMQTGWQAIDGDRYFFSVTGSMQRGFTKISGNTYYFDRDGRMKTGWQEIDGNKFYFDQDGKMLTGTQTLFGCEYVFNYDGVLLSEPKSLNSLLNANLNDPVGDIDFTFDTSLLGQYRNTDLPISIRITDAVYAYCNDEVMTKAANGDFEYLIKTNGSYMISYVTASGSRYDALGAPLEVTVIDKTPVRFADFNNGEEVSVTSFPYVINLTDYTTTDGVSCIDFYTMGIMRNGSTYTALEQATNVDNGTGYYKVNDPGNYTIYVSDFAGNNSTLNCKLVLAAAPTDTIPPVITITENPSTYWSNSAKRVKFEVTDNVAVQSVKIQSSIQTVDLAPLQDGTYACNLNNNGTYTIVATDTNGNVSRQTVVVDKIDTVAPYFVNVQNTDSHYGLPFTVRYNDADSGIFANGTTVTRNGESYTPTVGDSTSIILNDVGNYVVNIKDNAGNTASVSFELDTGMAPPITPPSITVDPISTAWTNSDVNVSFSVVSENTLETVTAGETTLPITSDGKYSFKADRNGSIVITATDNIGLSDSKTVNVVTIDKVNPSITGATEGGVYTEDVTLSIQDSLSGINSVVITKDGRVVSSTLDSNGRITLSDPGAYNVTVKDKANNTSILRFTIEAPAPADTQGPDIEYSLGTTAYTKQDVPVIMTITDNQSGVKDVKVDGNLLSMVSGKYSFEVTENGTFTVVATDNAGNSSTKQITVSNIDKIAPQITLSTATEGNVTTYSVNITDNLSGVKSYTVKKDGANYTYNLGDPITEAGEYVFTALDNADNSSSKVFNVVDGTPTEVDTEGPTISIDKGDQWTNKENRVVISAVDPSGIFNITLDGNAITSGTVVKYNENGSHTVVAEDTKGNISTLTFEIDNIDKEAPYSTNIVDGGEYDGPVVVDLADDLSGISTYRLYKDGKRCNGYTIDQQIVEPGTYLLSAYDYANNSTKIIFTIKSTSQGEDPGEQGNHHHWTYDYNLYPYLDPIWDDFWDDEFPEPGTGNTTNTTNTEPRNVIHPTNKVKNEVVDNQTNTTNTEGENPPHEPPPENIEYEDITFGGTLYYHYMANGYPGDVMPVDVSFTNLIIEKAEGVETFEANLNYNKDIYETITIDDIVTENGYVVMEEAGVRLRVFDVTNASMEDELPEVGLFFNGNPTSGSDARILINFPSGVKTPSKIFTINFKLKENATPGHYEDAIVFDEVYVSTHHVMSNELEFNIPTDVLTGAGSANNNNNGNGNANIDNNGSSNNGSNNNENNNGGTSNGNNNGTPQPNEPNTGSSSGGQSTTQKEVEGSANFKGKGSDNTTAKSVLPATGKGIRIILSILALIVVARIFYRKYENYRDI